MEDYSSNEKDKPEKQSMLFGGQYVCISTCVMNVLSNLSIFFY